MKQIIFSVEDVRAIMDGKKSQTRRVAKYRSGYPVGSDGRNNLYKMVETLNAKPFFGAGFYKDSDVFEQEGQTHIDAVYCKAPYKPGDVLWVRETWTCMRDVNTGEESYFFAAIQLDKDTVETTYLCDDEGFETDKRFPWKPSIFMPKKIARLFLRVTSVRAERLQDISRADAIDEGFVNDGDWGAEVPFEDAWNELYAKRGYGWDTNCWVFVISFERIERPSV